MGECTQPIVLRPGFAGCVLQGSGSVLCHIGDTPQIDFLLQDRSGCPVDTSGGSYHYKTTRAGSAITTAGTADVRMSNPAYLRTRMNALDTARSGNVKVTITELRAGGIVETYGPLILSVQGA